MDQVGESAPARAMSVGVVVPHSPGNSHQPRSSSVLETASTVSEVPASKTAPATRPGLEPAIGVSVPDQTGGIHMIKDVPLPTEEYRNTAEILRDWRLRCGLATHATNSSPLPRISIYWLPMLSVVPRRLITRLRGWRPRCLRRLTTAGLGAVHPSSAPQLSRRRRRAAEHGPHLCKP
jgi:hypothetical protein